MSTTEQAKAARDSRMSATQRILDELNPPAKSRAPSENKQPKRMHMVPPLVVAKIVLAERWSVPHFWNER